MKVEELGLPDLKLITLNSFADSRGFFVERYKRSAFQNAGLDVEFVQDNFSRSSCNVVRGLHYQWDKPQGKLVTCTLGRIVDVVVDLRFGSPSFGKTLQIELSAVKPQWVWIPPGFAHGFCVLSDEADFLYKCTAEYNSKGEAGIRWSDPDLRIQWPVAHPIVSPRDQEMLSFAEYVKNPKFHWGDRHV